MALNQNENVSITLKIEGEKAKNELALLEKQSRDLEKAIKEVPKGSAEWAELNKEVSKNRESQAKLREEIGITGLTYRQLQTEIKVLKKEVENATEGTEFFVEKSKRLNEFRDRAEEVKRSMAGVNDELDKPEKKGIWEKLKDGFSTVGESLKGALGIGALFGITSLINAIIQFGKDAVMAAAKASDSFGGIVKSTGMTTEEVMKLNSEIQKIDTRTAQDQLLKIAQVGGQIGVANDEMLGFVKSVDMAVVALGDEFSGGAEEVSTKLGVLSKVFKETANLKAGDAISQIGSAINELGAAGAATGPNIADFATRVAQLGNLAPSISQTLGLGAALEELGIKSEIGSSGLKNVMNGAALATDLFAKQVGLTEAEFKKLVNSSPNDMILKLAESFRGLPTTEVVKQMDALGITSNEAKAVMGALANQTELVNKHQAISAKAMKENVSLTKEFNVMNETAAAMLDKAGKAVNNLKMQIGIYLIPVLTACIAGFITFVKVIASIPDIIKENQKLFTALGVAILALNANNIKTTASTLASIVAEKARAIATKASMVAQELHLLALVAIETHNKKATTATYLSIVAENLRTAATNAATTAKTALRAILAALTLENIKNTVSSTAATVVEETRAFVTNGVTAAQTALRTITAALTLENIKNTATSVYHTTVEKGRAVITNTVAVAQGLLNAVMKANPIGVVITLIAGLVAGFKVLYDRSETVRGGMAGLWAAVQAVGKIIADVWEAFTSMEFGKVASILANGAKEVATAFTKGYADKLKSEAPKIVDTHKTIVKDKVNAEKQGLEETKLAINSMLLGVDEAYASSIRARMANADKTQLEAIKKELEANQNKNKSIGENDDKANKKKQDDKEKLLKSLEDTEAKYDAKVLKDRERALELVAEMEAENAQVIAETTLQIEEIKIAEKARKRKKEVSESLLDEQTKASQMEAIDQNSQIKLEKVREEFRLKQQKKDEEAAKKKQETDAFVLSQEQAAEKVMYDWRELQAKNNSTKLAAIQKERIDRELELNKQKMDLEMAAEKRQAALQIQDEHELASSLLQIENKYANLSLIAHVKAVDDKLKVDKDLKDKRVENLKLGSDTFKNLLSGDIQGFTTGMTAILEKGKTFWADMGKNDADGWITRLEMAKEAVSFLNNLAQAKAAKNILIAQAELAEREKILNREIAYTESLMASSSEYLTDLKEAETDRLEQLQTVLTSNTATEEEKRDAAKKYYSEQFLQMKDAEEEKVKQLQKMANLAKTNEEKAAIEAKIAMTQAETDEKIRLGEAQLAADIAKVDAQIALEYKLTSTTTDEETKKQMLKEYYSQQLQQLKMSEEAFITDLQRRANEAKTEDERKAIEAKIELAKKESAEKIRLAEQEAAAKTESMEGLAEATTALNEKLLKDAQGNSEKQIQIASDEAEQQADFKADLEETIAAENRKARAIEAAEKLKAFRAQKKADIATALITGAIAILKALANVFPLNIILAATAAVTTGVQIAKIKNQAEPVFAKDGDIIRGGKHGSSYGQGGIALIDRGTGREVGEMEGDEAIISADQTEANMPLIQEMFRNARSPGMRKKAIEMDGKPSFRDGGMFESPYWKKEMYLFGSKKKKAAAAAAAAEAEAATAQAEADAYTADLPSVDTSGYDGISGVEAGGDTAESQAAFAASQAQGKQQLELLEMIIETVEGGSIDIVTALSNLGTRQAGSLQKMGSDILELRGSIDSVRNAVLENVGATRGVEGAVREGNTNGVLHAIMDRISNLK